MNEELGMDEFYEAFGRSHHTRLDGVKRHDSPTKRLVDHKNTTQEHKEYLADAKTQKYGLHYTCSPQKSYMVEPRGELNYDCYGKNKHKVLYK